MPTPNNISLALIVQILYIIAMPYLGIFGTLVLENSNIIDFFI